MSYIIEVTMEDREGAVARLVMLFSQRHLDMVRFSSTRDGVSGLVTAVIEVAGASDRAPWALRQMSRHYNVLQARIRVAEDQPSAPSVQRPGGRTYPVRGRVAGGRRTLVVRRGTEPITAKS